MEEVRWVLDRLIAKRGDSYADLSRLLGRNPAYIQQFIKRGTPRKLDEADRRLLARYFGVSEEMLGGGSSQADVPSRARGLPAVVAVPSLSLGVSAGAGSFDADERVAGIMAFDARWLRHLGIKSQHASIIRVEGESMVPTLHDGDEILIDHDDAGAHLRDGIYVLRLDDALMVKRLALGPRRGRFSVLSDNPHFPNWQDIDPALVTIVGRVRWTGRRTQ